MTPRDLFESILIGIDSHGLAARAVVRGLELGRELGARVTVVHAVESLTAPVTGISAKEMASIQTATVVAARENVLEVVERCRLQARYAEKDADTLVRAYPGHPAQVLLEQSRRYEADLVLLGPHVKRRFLDFGGTARVVLARSQAPVWVQMKNVDPVEKILVAIDFSEHSRKALEAARALAHLFGASLHVLHAYAPRGAAATVAAEAFPGPVDVVDRGQGEAKGELERWMASLDWGGLQVDSIFCVGEAAARIAEAAEGADLVVMGTHGRTGLTRFLLGSVAYATLKRTETPVLVIPHARESWLIPEGNPLVSRSKAPAAAS